MADIARNIHGNSNNNLESTSTDVCFKEVQDIINGTEIPDDFDTWTVQEQCDWLHQNITPLLSNVPESLQFLTPAFFRQPNIKRSQEELPEWMDMDKYRRGQKFVRDHYTSIVGSILFGLMYALSFDGRKMLFLGGNSHTPYLAFTKYLTSIRWMLSWFDGEPWVKGTKAHKKMNITRLKHFAINKKAETLNNKQIDAAMKFENPWRLDYELLLKDLPMACPMAFEEFGQCPQRILSKTPFQPKGINMGYMAIVQGCFLTIPICSPEKTGLHGVTNEDIESLCYMWKCYGYFLGIEDEYNFCRGSFEEIKQRVWDLNQCWIKVNFKKIESGWIHVTKCIIESINYYPLMCLPYKMTVLLLTQPLNLQMSNLYTSLSYGEWIVYKIYIFMFKYLLKFSITRGIINQFFYKMFETASTFGPKKLAKIREKSKQQIPHFSINL